MRVLVAEDDLASQMVLRATLEGLGHECVVVGDGEAALQRVRDGGVDVVVTDLSMPGIDGLELCRRIRTEQPTGYTYIVIATARGRQEDVLSGMEAGADHYLTKPVDAFDLQTALVAARRVTDLHQELRRLTETLEHLAHTDPLTGLGNRRRLDEDIVAHHDHCARYGWTYSVAMCDLDCFKDYNDAYGHPAGDAALRLVADVLRATVRTGDGLYRYGGEEFAVLFPNQSPDEAETAAERLRRAVEARACPHERSPFGILTLSVGVAAGCPGSESAEKALAQADQALYRAKQAGRNRVAS